MKRIPKSILNISSTYLFVLTIGLLLIFTSCNKDDDSGQDLMPDFGSETIDDQTYTQNTAITTLTLPDAMGGDGTLTYSLQPALPAGLSFNAASRQLSGTPTAAAAMAEYTYKVADADNDEATLTFDITVEAPDDKMPTFGSETIADQTYTQNMEITTLTLPEATSGNGTLTYSLAPGLPTGLSFNATNRQITGTPMAGASTTEHTYKTADADND
ncbi:MAG: putative Ig domain-containing protein, partial [Ekhidna sp.]|nr:putative Ig domain-containing protein [Ekhidna sp.]